MTSTRLDWRRGQITLCYDYYLYLTDRRHGPPTACSSRCRRTTGRTGPRRVAHSNNVTGWFRERDARRVPDRGRDLHQPDARAVPQRATTQHGRVHRRRPASTTSRSTGSPDPVRFRRLRARWASPTSSGSSTWFTGSPAGPGWVRFQPRQGAWGSRTSSSSSTAGSQTSTDLRLRIQPATSSATPTGEPLARRCRPLLWPEVPDARYIRTRRLVCSGRIPAHPRREARTRRCSCALAPLLRGHTVAGLLGRFRAAFGARLALLRSVFPDVISS